MMYSVPNHVQNGAGFFVSFNDVDTHPDMYGSVTTALVRDQMDRFYVLNGDHRAAYRDLLADGFDACLDYFRANLQLVNKRSDTLA